MTGSDPGERGTLEVRSRVIERISTAAARTVAEVSTRDGGMAARSLPRAEVTLVDGRARAAVEAETAWPNPIVDVADRIRAAVTRDITTQGGVAVESVEVNVRYTAPDTREQDKRGRVE